MKHLLSYSLDISMTKLQYITLLLSLFVSLTKGLKSCEAENHLAKICSKNKVYSAPLPVNIQSQIFINEIQAVNEVERSITLFIELHTSWMDPSLFVSDGNM